MSDEYSTDEDDGTSSFEGYKAYARGGFHAAYVGELLGPKRAWRVASKLGFGVHATAWSACATAASRNAPATHAVKIHRADDDTWRDEVDTLMHVRGDTGILRIAASFDHRGPNGSHGCIVTELEGATVDAAVRALGALPSWVVIGIARDMLTGIAALHARGFVHTDIKADNVLLRPALSRALVGAPREMRIFARERKIKQRKFAKSAKPQPKAVAASVATPSTPSAPATQATPLEESAFGPGSFCVIGDLGNAERIKRYPPEPGSIQPRLYRAPEVVAYLPHTEAVDVYSAGAVVHYASTAGPLFDPEGDSSEERNVEHVRLIARALGPFPEYMRLASFVVRAADDVAFEPDLLAASDALWLVRALTTVDPHERPTAAAAAVAQSPHMVE
jgi:serine/threonine protein kinase